MSCVPLGTPLLLLLPGVIVTCSGGRRNNHGSSSGSEFPACRAWFAEQSVVPRYGAVPGVGAATSCSSCRAGAGCDQRARGGAEWGTQSQQGNARALHPFHSMDTHIQAHVPVWQSSRLQAGTDVCFPSGTVRVLC